MGTSAGSIVVGPDINFIGELDDISKGHLTDFAGLELMTFRVTPDAQKISRAASSQPLEPSNEVIDLADTEALLVWGHSARLMNVA